MSTSVGYRIISREPTVRAQSAHHLHILLCLYSTCFNLRSVLLWSHASAHRDIPDSHALGSRVPQPRTVVHSCGDPHLQPQASFGSRPDAHARRGAAMVLGVGARCCVAMWRPDETEASPFSGTSLGAEGSRRVTANHTLI